MHLPLYNARVYWYSYVALFSHKMLKTAITVPILLLVRLPSDPSHVKSIRLTESRFANEDNSYLSVKFNVDEKTRFALVDSNRQWQSLTGSRFAKDLSCDYLVSKCLC